MGLFDFGKKEKKKETSKKSKPKEEFEVGENGLVFNAKFQILTKSKEYAQEVSKKYAESIKQAQDQKQNKKYFIIKQDISKPEKLSKEELKDVPGENEAYTCMLDFEIGVKKKTNIFDFCFEFMPFFVEVVSPMNINFTASELTNYITNIQATIHKIDETLKAYKLRTEDLTNKYGILSKNMVRMLRNNIILTLKQKSKDIKEISKSVGIPEEQLKPFIDTMVDDKEIKLEKNKYKFVK
jgi:hypothetical protein